MHIQDIESGIKSIHVGAGTTKTGYQVRPLLPSTSGFQEIINLEAPHNSSVYVTVVATNNADLKSTYHSAAIVIDHTKPNISNVNVDITYEKHLISKDSSDNRPDNTSEMSENRTLTTIKVTWTITDDESGIHECECGAGKCLKQSFIIDYMLLYSNDSDFSSFRTLSTLNILNSLGKDRHYNFLFLP
jgi:hypothetical protein